MPFIIGYYRLVNKIPFDCEYVFLSKGEAIWLLDFTH